MASSFSKKRRFTDEGFTEIQNLEPGMRVYKRVGSEAYGDYKTMVIESKRGTPESSVLLDEKLGALLGWYMGDGYLNTHHDYGTFGFCFSEDEKGIHDSIWNTLESLFLRNTTIKEIKK